MDNPIPLETLDTTRKSSRFLLPAGVLLLIVAAVSGYAWYDLYSPCGVDAVKTAPLP
jgi:hypothetical protein